jgi:hypothetical protein
MMTKLMLWTGVAFAAALTGVTSAEAAGALAVGIHNNDPGPGIALGGAVDHDEEGEAKYGALSACLSFVDAGLEPRVSCKVVATFRGQCYAVAMDPEPGTPGFGWSIGNGQADANKKALEKCRAVGGARASFCTVTFADCDTKGAAVAAIPPTATPLSLEKKASPAGGRAKK